MNMRMILRACTKHAISACARQKNPEYLSELGMERVQTLETSVSDLLKSSLDDPWSLLMIQTLIWCFRRWAIHYLTSDETTSTMREFVWDTYLDLVDQFSPPDLREFALIWLNPENVGLRANILEDLNHVFLQIVDAFDHALQTEDDEEQNALADFIDITLTTIMDTVLAEKQQFRIYPTRDESPDSFSTLRIYTIMESILDRFSCPTPVVAPATAPVVASPEVAPAAPVPAPTVAAALLRRRTRRANRRISTATTRKNRALH